MKTTSSKNYEIHTESCKLYYKYYEKISTSNFQCLLCPAKIRGQRTTIYGHLKNEHKELLNEGKEGTRNDKRNFDVHAIVSLF